MRKPLTGALAGAVMATAITTAVLHSLPQASTSDTPPSVTAGPTTGPMTGDVVRVVERATSRAAAARTSSAALSRDSRLRVRFPKRAVVGTRIAVKGKVPAARTGRPVVLFAKRAGTFRRISAVKADARGRFQFKVRVQRPTGRIAWRVTARRFAHTAPQNVTFRMVVVAPKGGSTSPTPVAAGSPRDWTFISEDKSMRWDACTPITWHYAPMRQAYPGAEQDMVRAIRMLADQTGLTFTRSTAQTEAALTISWATPAQEPQLAGSTIGLGGPGYISIDPARNGGTEAQIVTGEVTFDATAEGRPGFTDPDGWAWGQVFLHEVMHALGLGHARGQAQVMFPMASNHNQRFGAGDLGGLAVVGAQKGCIDTSQSLQPLLMRSAVISD